MSDNSNDNDDDNMLDDNQDEIEKMLNEAKKAKAHKKKLFIIIISLIIILIILSVLAILYFFLIKNKKNENNEKNEKNEKNNYDYDTTPLIVGPTENYSYCVIFLHGLNDTAEHFKALFEDINFSKINSTKFMFLKAPKKDVSYKNMKNVTSWFNIFSLPFNSSDNYNFDDATESKNKLNEIIINESKLLNNNFSKIILGGHSQGACMSLYTAYSADYLLGGVISLNGILFEQAQINGNKEDLQVFIYHGGKDKQIPLGYHNKTIERILKGNNNIQRFYNENETHFLQYFSENINNLEDFLNQILI